MPIPGPLQTLAQGDLGEPSKYLPRLRAVEDQNRRIDRPLRSEMTIRVASRGLRGKINKLTHRGSNPGSRLAGSDCRAFLSKHDQSSKIIDVTVGPSLQTRPPSFPYRQKTEGSAHFEAMAALYASASTAAL